MLSPRCSRGTGPTVTSSPDGGHTQNPDIYSLGHRPLLLPWEKLRPNAGVVSVRGSTSESPEAPESGAYSALPPRTCHHLPKTLTLTLQFLSPLRGRLSL